MILGMSHVSLRTSGLWFAICVSLMALSGCAGSTNTVGGPRHAPLEPGHWDALDGVWLGDGSVQIGRRRFPSEILLSLSRDRSALEIRLDDGGVARARLYPVGSEEGSIVFEARNPDFEDLDAALRSGMPIGRVVLSEGRDGGYDVKPLHSDYDPDDRRTWTYSSFRVTAVTPLPLAPVENFGDVGPFVYEDWRTRGASSVYELADHEPEDVIDRLRTDILSLREGGWRCVGQTERTVRPGEVTRVVFDGSTFSSRAFLVHSSVPQARLAWSAGREKYSRTRASSIGYGHPIVVSGHAADTEFVFRILPPPGALDAPTGATVVTVLEFIDNPLDISSSCDLDRFGLEAQRSLGHHLQLLGTTIIALGLEGIRREAVEDDNLVVELLAENLRDRATESVLRQAAPDASDDEIEYFMRWIGVVTSYDILAVPLGRQSAREWFADYIAGHAPEYAHADALIDMLVDVYLEAAAGRSIPR